MGISSESITSGSNFTSGFQLKLSKQGVIDHNKDKQDLYREPIRLLCRLIMDTETLFGTTNYPPNAKINIDYADIAVEVDPLEQEQIRAMKMSNGTMDRVMALMEDNPDMQEQDAIEQLSKMDARKRNMATPAPIEIDTEDNETV